MMKGFVAALAIDLILIEEGRSQLKTLQGREVAETSYYRRLDGWSDYDQELECRCKIMLLTSTSTQTNSMRR